jgi:transposase-like protein
MTKTRGMELWEYRRQESLEGAIREGLSTAPSVRALADRLEVSQVTLYDWIERLGYQIEVRRELVPLTK